MPQLQVTLSIFLLGISRAFIVFGFPFAGYLVFFLGAAILLFSIAAKLPKKEITFLRGREHPRDAAEKDTQEEEPGDSVIWGGETLPAATATTHFLVAGTTGSGKTVVLNLLMQSVLPFIGKTRKNGKPFNRRALVYDPKGDVLSTLHGITDAKITTLHPFDERGAAWDIAKDITTPAAALQAAAILMPQDKNATGNPFFILAAQNLLRGVLLSFLQTAEGKWTLRDVVLALRFEERLREVLSKTMEGRAIIDQFFRTGSETLQGVRGTIATKIAPFEVIAAAWDTATEKVSLTAFLESESVLVLGNDESTRTALDAINRVIFQRLSEMILSQPETKEPQTWIFLDEVREAGKLDGLSRLMTKSRSKGACIALGFQAIEGMREVYGDNITDEITGLCNNKAILLLESPTSAKWASELFGKTEEIDRRETWGRTQNGKEIIPSLGRSRSLSEQRLTTDAVMASEVMTLPAAGTVNGLSGLFITRAKGSFRKSSSWCKIAPLLPRRAAHVEDFVKRPDQAQYLREWEAEDFKRLGLKPLHLVGKDRDDQGERGDEVGQHEWRPQIRPRVRQG